MTVDEVLEIYRLEIEASGGSYGLRDAGLLSSAAAQPMATYDGVFLNADLFEMAAAYIFSIVKSHPFVDGNKRGALATSIAFLELNGLVLDESANDCLYDAVTGVAEGRIRKDRLTQIIRRLFSTN